MKKSSLYFLALLAVLSNSFQTKAQLRWQNMDNQYAPLPGSIHVYYSNDPIDGKPNRAFYTEIDLKDKNLQLYADTANQRGLTPSQYYARNHNPYVVVNCTFFSLTTKANLNIVIKNGKLVAHNIPSIYNKSDSLWHGISRSAIGINKRGKPDVAWVFTDSVKNKAWQLKEKPAYFTSKMAVTNIHSFRKEQRNSRRQRMVRWRMQTAVGGGPALISNSKINITNNEEIMFAGERINDRHPRTAMGYTDDGKFIILTVEGRFQGIAEGASLPHLARILLDLHCVEALNLDGGGSSCMLVNGKNTITPSDKTGQRPVPAVFVVK